MDKIPPMSSDNEAGYFVEMGDKCLGEEAWIIRGRRHSLANARTDTMAAPLRRFYFHIEPLTQGGRFPDNGIKYVSS